jgi:hypothetical protein
MSSKGIRGIRDRGCEAPAGDHYPRRIKWTEVALKEAVTVIPIRKSSSSRDWAVMYADRGRLPSRYSL